jgi:large subunit ribosomal protein L19e
MKLNIQKKLAGKLAKVSPKRIKLDNERVEDIKESITKADIKGLIKDKAITVKQKKGVSRARANKIKEQKSKGRRKGPGSHKGKKTARAPKKDMWIKKVRIQRETIRELKDKEYISASVFRMLYKKIKGGFFRSKRHLKLYIEEHNLVEKNVNK